jgi:hypothetical protein
MADRKYDWAKYVVLWGSVGEGIEWNEERAKE